MPAPLRRDDALAESLIHERRRHFDANKWSGPFGVGAAAVLYIGIVGSDLPRELRWVWLGAMLSAVGLMFVAFAVGPLSRWTDRQGLPMLSCVAHALVGTMWGLALWIDLDATRQPEFRWMTIAMLMAVTSGAGTGLSGVNVLGRLVIVPMWLVSAGAMVAVGEVLTVVAIVVFVGLSLHDTIESGRTWRELVRLQIESHMNAEQHEWAANHDSLTSLLNRAGLFDRLESAAWGGRPTTGLFVDLDRFKAINDEHGHRSGDAVLRAVSERLLATVRDHDLVARLGGDEFFVAIDRTSERLTPADGEPVDRLVQRLLERIEEPIELPNGATATISASIGVVERLDADTERLLADADHALYRAKRAGRGRMARHDVLDEVDR